ncbi:hypothetical protein DRO24_00385 [Candidatus Bathyarchaeota archaeon]|nr:MAG: hypothetical protein DRO24_00385 [Candidatus Bathyarchaeota archaeon]
MLRDNLYAGNSFIIFENPEVRSIRVDKRGGSHLRCPHHGAIPGEEERIKALMPNTSRNMETGKLISYQKWFEIHELYRAAELVDKLFTQIFDLPADYELRYLSG